jgi:hypothetical protein
VFHWCYIRLAYYTMQWYAGSPHLGYVILSVGKNIFVPTEPYIGGLLHFEGNGEEGRVGGGTSRDGASSAVDARGSCSAGLLVRWSSMSVWRSGKVSEATLAWCLC